MTVNNSNFEVVKSQHFTSSLDLDYIRSDFPTLSQQVNGNPLVYFDSGASALKPRIMIEAISDFYSNYYSNVHRGVHSLSQQATDTYESVRVKLQEFIKAPLQEEIIFTSGTTEAINLVANSFCQRFCEPGDTVLISEMEHHANIVSWQLVCEKMNLNLGVIQITDQGELDLSSLKSKLNSKVKIVAIPHVSNVLGTINPIDEIAVLVHQNGTKLMVDGAQAVPHMPVDVAQLDVDFYTFSGHKLFGPTGVGILYGKSELLNQMDPIMGGGDMIDQVTFQKTTFNSIPHKFEAGTPNIAGFIGMGASLDYINNLGMEQINQYENRLTDYMLQQLQGIDGLRLLGQAPNRAAVFSFVFEGIHHLDIGTLLNEYGIAIRTGHHCCQPLMQRMGVTGSARASLAFYNTKEEIDYFIMKLSQVKLLLS